MDSSALIVDGIKDMEDIQTDNRIITEIFSTTASELAENPLLHYQLFVACAERCVVYKDREWVNMYGLMLSMLRVIYTYEPPTMSIYVFPKSPSEDILKDVLDDLRTLFIPICLSKGQINEKGEIL